MKRNTKAFFQFVCRYAAWYSDQAFGSEAEEPLVPNNRLISPDLPTVPDSLSKLLIYEAELVCMIGREYMWDNVFYPGLFSKLGVAADTCTTVNTIPAKYADDYAPDDSQFVAFAIDASSYSEDPEYCDAFLLLPIIAILESDSDEEKFHRALAHVTDAHIHGSNLFDVPEVIDKFLKEF